MADPRAVLESHLKAAGARARALACMQRMQALLPWLAGSVIALSLGIWLLPAASLDALRLVSALYLAGMVLFSVSPMFARWDRIRSAMFLDHELGLQDSALAALELSGDSPWNRKVLEHTLGELATRQPALPKPDRAVHVFGILLSCLAAALVLWVPKNDSPTASQPLAAGETDPYEELLAEWESLAQADPAVWEAMVPAIEELKSALAEPPANKADLLMKVARAEDRLKTAMSPGEILERLLPSLSAALGSSFPSLSQALAAGNLSAAASALKSSAQSPPEGLRSEEAEDLQELIRQLEEAGLQELAEALRQLRQSRNASETGEAATRLANALSAAQALQQQMQAMSMARMKLAAARQGNSQASQPGQGKGEEKDRGLPGTGAGEDDQPRFGNRRLDVQNPSLLAPLSGTKDPAGETLVEDLPSETVLEENAALPRSGAKATRGELSSTAVEAENLAPAHRAIVKRYFEAIRPSSQNPTP